MLICKKSLPLLLPPPMATIEDSFSVCLMTTMDSLWFHQTILIQTDPLADSLLLGPLSDKPASPETSSDSLPQLPQTQTSSVSLPTTTPHQDEEQELERPARLRLETKRARSQSSSPCTQRRHRLKNLKYSSSNSLSGTKLEKTTSSKTLGELELEEVKGFMDLGFIFKKEDLSSRMMNLVPGLKRIGSLYKSKLHIDDVDEDIDTEERGFDGDEDDDDVKSRGVMRPYLSEAWLIKRPDSPLLNLRVPRMYASCNDAVMKKHLRFWAKTVVLVTQQES